MESAKTYWFSVSKTTYPLSEMVAHAGFTVRISRQDKIMCIIKHEC